MKAVESRELPPRRNAERRWRHWFSTNLTINIVILLFTTTLLGILWGSVLALIQVDREETTRANFARIENLAVAMEHYARRIVANADTVVSAVAREYARGGGTPDLLRLLAESRVGNSFVLGVGFADPRGHATLANPSETTVNHVDVSDREHFRIPRDRNDGKLFIGKPATSRHSGKTLIPITKRINLSDGTFGGVAMVLLEPSSFIEVLREADFGPRDILSVVGSDGVTRVRLRGAEISWGQDIGAGRLFTTELRKGRNGTYVGNGHLDGVPRMFSYRQLLGQDIVVTVGTAELEAMASFHRRRAQTFWAAGSATAVICACAVLLMLELANRLRREEAIARQHGLLVNAQRVGGMGIWELDIPSGRITWSAETQRIFGIDLQRFANSLEAFLALVHPADAGRLRALHGLPSSGRSAVEVEYRIVRPDGEERVVFERGEVDVDAAGRPQCRLGVVMDITDRRRAEIARGAAEEKYRAIFDNSTEGIFQNTPDGQLLAANPALARMMGFPSAEEFVRECSNVEWQNHVDPTLRREFRQRLEEHGSISGFEHEVRRKDGTRIWISENVRVVRDAAGQIGYCEGSVQDITERKFGQEALKSLNAELESRVSSRTAELSVARDAAERANHAKSAFLATMSHEIRTPMNGVIGMIDVLAQSRLTRTQVATLDIARDSAYALLAIIDDVLDFSKIEAGQFQVDAEPMDMATLVEAVCATLEPVAARLNVTLTLFTDPALPSLVRGDAGRLRQVMLNLVGNAIKFSTANEPPGRVSVRAAWVEAGLPLPVVELSVADNGIGMDEVMLERLFSPFTQGDVSTTRRFGGTGLGLSISHALIEMMGGRIDVQSEPGRGSTFTVRLPLEALPGGNKAAADAIDLDGLACLVPGGTDGPADDLLRYLVHQGATVRREPGVAAACDWLRQCRSTLPVVVVIAGADAVTRQRALAELQDACAPSLDGRFVVIGRGQPSGPQPPSGKLVRLGRDAVYRFDVLTAVARAAGRLAQPPEEPASNGAANTWPAPLIEPTSPSGASILVAEDNLINQMVLRHQLALLGFDADMTGNGREALDRLRHRDYRLLLTDLHMPDMDGFELVAAIRDGDLGPRMAIVAITANAMQGESRRCLDAGMDDCMTKPVQLVDLKAMLAKWLPDHAGEIA